MFSFFRKYLKSLLLGAFFQFIAGLSLLSTTLSITGNWAIKSSRKRKSKNQQQERHVGIQYPLITELIPFLINRWSISLDFISLRWKFIKEPAKEVLLKLKVEYLILFKKCWKLLNNSHKIELKIKLIEN